jgi:hypothetical protein
VGRIHVRKIEIGGKGGLVPTLHLLSLRLAAEESVKLVNIDLKAYVFSVGAGDYE